MQGSLWKTVAVVGVIGIGGLAILEVQKRLDAQNAQIEPADAEKLAEQILSNGEEAVTAELTNSQFDQLMADAGAPGSELNAGQFAAAESVQPTAIEESTVSHSPAAEQFAAEFNDSAPVDAQPNMPANVDTAVRAEAISGGNPFLESDAVVAANLKSVPEESGVQPTGFEDTSSFSPDEPFQRDPEPATATSTPDTTGRMMLFSAGGDPSSDETAALKAIPEENPATAFEADTTVTADAIPSAGSQPAQFYSNETDTGGAGELEPFRNEVTTEQPASNEFEPFRNEGVADSAAPSFDQPSTEPQPFPTTDQPGSSFEPFPMDPAGSPAASTETRTETTSQEIPFVEDVPGSEIPTLEESPRLTFPTPTPEPDQTFEIPPEFPQDDARESELKPFPTLEPEPSPEMTRPESRSFDSMGSDSPQPFTEDISESENGGVRGNGGVRRFEPQENERSAPVRSFDPSPVPYPDNSLPDIRPSRDMTDRREFTPERREFGSDPLIDPAPRSRFDDRDSRPSSLRRDENIRQVASVMRPNVVLSKEAPDNATVGTPLKYRILVRNDGDATAYEVVVEDEVTSAAEVNAASPIATRDRATNRLIWTFDEVAPGETKEIVVKVTPTGEGVLDGVATVKFKSRVKSTTVITAPKLQLQMIGPDEVRLGEEVAYRYVITNKGSGEARNVFVRTVLPASGGLKHPAGNDLEYEITALQPDEQREIVLAVVAAEPGEYRAQAEVTAAGGVKDQASWRTNIVGAQLKIDRRGPKRRFVGRSAVYENIVSNDTNFDALDARVTERVPEGMRFVSASEGGRYDANSRTVTWRVNRIGPGKMTTLQIELMPMQAGPLESVVTIFENAGIQSDDYVSTTQVEDLHNVSADISQLDGPVAVGETFGFTISIDNRGTADASDVELFVDVPEEIQVMGAGSREIPAKLLSGNRVEYRIIVRIAPNEQKDFELKLRGKQALRNGMVKASVRYKEMTEPLVVSESVTVYRDDL